MKADFACMWGTEAAPGGYSTSTATSDLPGRLGIACSKFGFTVSRGAGAAAVALPHSAIAEQNAIRLGRRIMAFLPLDLYIFHHGWYE
jgi:hypothetical protein